MIVVMAGLPGSGKSALAARIAVSLPARVLDKDTIRAALFPPDEIEYSSAQDDFCMHVMMDVAAFVLRRDPARHIIVDGRTFSRGYQLACWRSLAAELGVPIKVIECVISDETARARLERDVSEGRHVAANRDYAMYLAVKARAEPVQGPKLVIDTEQELDACTCQALAYLQGG